MSENIHEYKGATIQVYHDEFADSPRMWQMGTYLTNDEVNEANPATVSAVREKLSQGHSTKNVLKNHFPEMVWFAPLYRYSHGSSTWALHRNFPDQRWDLSHCGYVIIERHDIKKHFNRTRMSEKLSALIYEQVARELDEFTNWANGDVYAFMVEGSGIIDLDDCSYGGYNTPDEALDNAKAMIDYERRDE